VEAIGDGGLGRTRMEVEPSLRFPAAIGEAIVDEVRSGEFA